jgi:hypothetical protein
MDVVQTTSPFSFRSEPKTLSLENGYAMHLFGRHAE